MDHSLSFYDLVSRGLTLFKQTKHRLSKIGNVRQAVQKVRTLFLDQLDDRHRQAKNPLTGDAERQIDHDVLITYPI